MTASVFARALVLAALASLCWLILTAIFVPLHVSA